MKVEEAMRARGEETMRWQVGNDVAVMTHDLARLCLATPLRVAGAPPARMLSSIRVTEGTFCDTGERFRRVDSWRARSTAHLSLERPWQGRTVFVLLSESGVQSAEESAHKLASVASSGQVSLRSVMRPILNATSAGGSEFPDPLSSSSSRSHNRPTVFGGMSQTGRAYVSRA